MKTVFTSLVLIFITINLASADILTLSNGAQFSGDVKRIKDCEVIFKFQKHRYSIPVADIEYIGFTNPNSDVLNEYENLSGSDKCLKGTFDASYHKGDGTAFALGVLFGPFAVIGEAVASPSPYNGKETMMLSKNKGLFNDPAYLTCYSKNVRKKHTGSAALGWAAWILLILAVG